METSWSISENSLPFPKRSRRRRSRFFSRDKRRVNISAAAPRFFHLPAPARIDWKQPRQGCWRLASGMSCKPENFHRVRVGKAPGSSSQKARAQTALKPNFWPLLVTDRRVRRPGNYSGLLSSRNGVTKFFQFNSQTLCNSTFLQIHMVQSRKLPLRRVLFARIILWNTDLDKFWFLEVGLSGRFLCILRKALYISLSFA